MKRSTTQLLFLSFRNFTCSKYFSILTNIRKLFTTKKDGFDKASNLNVFSGVRTLMMFCVIYGHTGMIEYGNHNA